MMRHDVAWYLLIYIHGHLAIVQKFIQLEVTMKFATVTFNVSTQVKANTGAIVTALTLTEGEVADEVITNSLLSGQSPRGRLQNGYRANGRPKAATMTWAEYITPGRAPKVHIPESVDQLAARAKAD